MLFMRAACGAKRRGRGVALGLTLLPAAPARRRRRGASSLLIPSAGWHGRPIQEPHRHEAVRASVAETPARLVRRSRVFGTGYHRPAARSASARSSSGCAASATARARSTGSSARSPERRSAGSRSSTACRSTGGRRSPPCGISAPGPVRAAAVARGAPRSARHRRQSRAGRPRSLGRRSVNSSARDRSRLTERAPRRRSRGAGSPCRRCSLSASCFSAPPP